MATPSSSSGQNLRKAAAPPKPPWTPTGGRTINAVPHPHDASKLILKVKYELRASGHGGKKTATSLDGDYPGAPGFLGCYRLKQWTTRKAAEAAIPQPGHARERAQART